MRRLLIIVGLTATLAAGACGGSPAASSTTSTTKDPEKAMLDFAKCMREHGVDMPDPETDGNGRGRVTLSGGPGDESKMEAAQKACQKYMAAAGPGSLDPEQRQKLEDAMLAFAKCMRSKGIDMPDPEFSSNGGMAIRRQAGGAGKAGQRPIDDDPKFAEAEKVCRKDTLEPVEKSVGISGGSGLTRSKG